MFGPSLQLGKCFFASLRLWVLESAALLRPAGRSLSVAGAAGPNAALCSCFEHGRPAAEQHLTPEGARGGADDVKQGGEADGQKYREAAQKSGRRRDMILV